jgi:hypothetical protein
MSVLQDLIPEAIPSQKYHVNAGVNLSGYRAMDIGNTSHESCSIKNLMM